MRERIRWTRGDMVLGTTEQGNEYHLYENHWYEGRVYCDICYAHIAHDNDDIVALEAQIDAHYENHCEPEPECSEECTEESSHCASLENREQHLQWVAGKGWVEDGYE